MLHHDDDLLDARDEVHRAAHALDHLARHHPVREVALLADLHAAEHGEVDVPAADHREAGRTVEIARLRKLADRLLARVDQIWIDLVIIRERPDAEHPVLALQSNGDTLGHVIGDERRNADAEVHVETITQLFRRPRRHLVAGPALGQRFRAHFFLDPLIMSAGSGKSGVSSCQRMEATSHFPSTFTNWKLLIPRSWKLPVAVRPS